MSDFNTNITTRKPSAQNTVITETGVKLTPISNPLLPTETGIFVGTDNELYYYDGVNPPIKLTSGGATSGCPVYNDGTLVIANPDNIDFTDDFNVTNPSGAKALVDLKNIDLSVADQILPYAHNTVDLGADLVRYKDIWYAGTLHGGSSPMYLEASTPTNEGEKATGSIEIIDNGLTPTDWIQVDGSGHLIPGTHFTVGVDATATAINLAAAINLATAGLTATPSAAFVNLEYDTPGPDGNLVTLTAVTPSPGANPPGPGGWEALAYSPELGITVALAWDRNAWSDDGGVNWTTNYTQMQYTSGFSASIAYSPQLQRFCAMEYTTPGICWTSDDGKIWTKRTGLPHKATKVLWVPPPISLFVSVTGSNSNNVLMTSPDGIVWTNRTVTPTNASLQFLAYGTPSPAIPGYPNGIIVAADISANNRVFISADGITWVTVTTNQRGGPVAWSPALNKFCMIYNQGSSQTNGIQMSANGTTWTAVNGPDVNGFAHLIWEPTLGLFVATRTTAGATNHIYTSPDGVNWTFQTTPDYTWSQTIWHSGINKLLTVTGGDTLPNLMTSPTGTTWTGNGTGFFLPSKQTWTDIIWAGGSINKFVATMGGRVAMSSDGITWTESLAPTLPAHTCVVYSPDLGKFVALGSSTSCWTSVDGLTWTAFTGVPHGSTGICWSPEQAKFVAVNSTSTAANTAMTSPDGTTWTVCAVGVAGFYQNVQWAAARGLYIAGGSSSGTHVMTSPDGSNWTSRTIPLVSAIDVAYSPTLDMFAAVRWDNAAPAGPRTGIICTSTDGGVTWSNQLAYPAGWQHMQWCSGLGMFIACADYVLAGYETTHIMTSTDGVNWTPRATPNAYYWKMAYSPTLNVALALSTNTAQNIVRSADGLTWAVPQVVASAKYDLSGATLTGGTDVIPTAFVMDTLNAQSMDGATILSVRTAGAEKLNVGGTGEVTVYDRILPESDDTIDIGGVDPDRFSNIHYADTIYGGGDKSMKFKTQVADAPPPTSSSGVITIIEQPTPTDWLQVIGRPYAAGSGWPQKLVPGTDFAIGVDTAATAANLAGAINAAGIEATAAAVGSTVTVTVDDPGTWGNLFKLSMANVIVPVPPPVSYWHAVAWSPTLNLFAMVGGTGSTRVATSPDGIIWTGRSSPLHNWVSIAWGNGAFVAVADDGYCMRSTNGTTWTDVPVHSNGWSAVGFGGGNFVAVAGSSTADPNDDMVMTSSDGSSWSYHAAPEQYPGGYYSYKAVAYGGGRWIAVADYPGGRIMKSDDGGSTWSLVPASVGYGNGLAYGGGVWVCVGYRVGSPFNYDYTIYSSSDGGNTWVQRIMPEVGTIEWGDVTYSPELGLFCAVSWNATNGKVMTSTNGATWTQHATPYAALMGVCWSAAKNMFVAVGPSFSPMVLTSSNGTAWSAPSGSLKYSLTGDLYTDYAGQSWWRFNGGADNPPAILFDSADEIKTSTNRLFTVKNEATEYFSIHRGPSVQGQSGDDELIWDFANKDGYPVLQISTDPTPKLVLAENKNFNIGISSDWTYGANYRECGVSLELALPLASITAYADEVSDSGFQAYGKSAWLWCEDLALSEYQELAIFGEDYSAAGRTDVRFNAITPFASIGLASNGAFFGKDEGSPRWLFESMAADGASAVGFELNTYNAFTTTGAKLLSLKNDGTEKFYVDKDGMVLAGNISVTGTYANIPGTPTDLESVISALDTIVGNESLWDRSGTVLAPQNVGDSLDMAGGGYVSSVADAAGVKATATITVIDNALEIGDTITITDPFSVAFDFVVGTDFVAGADTTETATNLRNAIVFKTPWEFGADSVGNVVTVSYYPAGTLGNSCTITETDGATDNFTLSGPNFTGGVNGVTAFGLNSSNSLVSEAYQLLTVKNNGVLAASVGTGVVLEYDQPSLTLYDSTGRPTVEFASNTTTALDVTLAENKNLWLRVGNNYNFPAGSRDMYFIMDPSGNTGLGAGAVVLRSGKMGSDLRAATLRLIDSAGSGGQQYSAYLYARGLTGADLSSLILLENASGMQAYIQAAGTGNANRHTITSYDVSGLGISNLRHAFYAANAVKVGIASDGALASASGVFKSNVADGASAVGHSLDTVNNLSTSGAKLFSLLNQGAEKFYIDKDGVVVGGSSPFTLKSKAAGGTYASGTVEFINNSFDVGDKITLTAPWLEVVDYEVGVDFAVGVDVNETATNFAAVVPVKMPALVVESVVGAVVTIRQQYASADGNSWAMAVTDGATPNITISGPNFTGGSDADNSFILDTINSSLSWDTSLLEIRDSGVNRFAIKQNGSLILGTDFSVIGTLNGTTSLLGGGIGGVATLNLLAYESEGSKFGLTSSTVSSQHIVRCFSELTGGGATFFWAGIADIPTNEPIAGMYIFDRDTAGIGVADTRVSFVIDNAHAVAIGADGALVSAAGILKSNVADGASAVGYSLDTVNALATAGAKLLSLKNATVEKAYFDMDGKLYLPDIHLTGTLPRAIEFGDGTFFGAQSKIQFKEVSDTNTDGIEISNGDDNGDFIIKGGWNEWNNVIIDTRDAGMRGSAEQGWLLLIRNGGPANDAFRIGSDNYGDANVIDFMQTDNYDPTIRALRISGVYGLEFNGDHTKTPELKNTYTSGGNTYTSKITLKNNYSSDTALILETSESTGSKLAKIVLDTDAKSQYLSGAADGASAIGHEFNTNATLSNVGAKLLSVKNNGNEKFSVGVEGGINVRRRTTATDASSAGEVIIGVTDTSITRTITLDTDDLVDGRIIIIKDESGGAATNNITVKTEGGAGCTIDGVSGATGIPITANYGCLRVYSNGTHWFSF